MDAYARLIVDCGGLLKGAEVQGIGRLAAAALYARLLRMASSVGVLVRNGHADEARPNTRAMLNAAAGVVYIAESSTDERGLAFFAGRQLVRTKLIKDLTRVGFKAEELESWDTALKANEESWIRKARSSGLRLEFRKDQRSWHGLTDAELIRRADDDWLSSYTLLSEEVHAGPMSTDDDVVRIVHQDAGLLTGAPGFDDPLLVLRVAGFALIRAATALDHLLGLKQDTLIDSLEPTLVSALSLHATRTGRAAGLMRTGQRFLGTAADPDRSKRADSRRA